MRRPPQGCHANRDARGLVAMAVSEPVGALVERISEPRESLEPRISESGILLVESFVEQFLVESLVEPRTSDSGILRKPVEELLERISESLIPRISESADPSGRNGESVVPS